ncbi:hypothetical protein Emag_001260 [Eimeria magna]
MRVLAEDFDFEHKALPYVGNLKYMSELRPHSRGWLNSLAVFPGSHEEALHGKLGVKEDGAPLWTPTEMPEPIDSPSVGRNFFSSSCVVQLIVCIAEVESFACNRIVCWIMNRRVTVRPTSTRQQVNKCDLSPLLVYLKRIPDVAFHGSLLGSLHRFRAAGSRRIGPKQLSGVVSRDPICLKVHYDLQELSETLDTTIVITFFNEPMSTLLRTLHSVLNFTPPPLIREILLVDDASNSTALMQGNELDEYIPHLPKVKLLRMGERSGIVPARMRGIRAARAPVVVILDSHIEVNDGWLEPQLARIHQSPKSFVFPQTLSIIATNFEHTKDTGIGKDTLMEIGGYDEGFTMWGAENVEFSFRIWMCGARLECTPCAAVYHIFRQGGTGYPLPQGSVWKNRMRTAKLWMGDYFPLAAAFNSHHLSHTEPDLPDMTEMEKLKERLKCKDMNWFMKNVDPKHEFQDLSTALAGMGDIRSVYKPSICLDALGETDVGQNLGFYQCHGQLGNQAFLLVNETKQLRLMGIGKTSRTRLCVTPPGVLERCTKQNVVGHMDFDSEAGTIRWTGPDKYKDHCLGLEEESAGVRLQYKE